jgi:hypothetical protein
MHDSFRGAGLPGYFLNSRVLKTVALHDLERRAK